MLVNGMKRSAMIGITVLLVAVASGFSLAGIQAMSGTGTQAGIQPDLDMALVTSDYTTHDPILITSNADFVSQGWPGNGTLEDPYVIEGLAIVGPYAEYQAAIRVQDTTVSYIIRNCILYDVPNSASPMKGIIAANAENSIIEGNVFDSISYWAMGSIGIQAVDCCNMTIISNRLSGCQGYGLYDGNGYFYDSIVGGNIISNCLHGIQLGFGGRNEITNNVILNSTSCGMNVGNSNSILSGNVIKSSAKGDARGSGLYVLGTGTMVFNNMISGCSVGLSSQGQENTFYNNTVEENEYGMRLAESARRNNVTWNGFVNNSISVWNDASLVWFDHNYWSDYNGSDANSDGIGDVPYENFYEGVTDNHPLMYWPWHAPPAATTTATMTLDGQLVSPVVMTALVAGVVSVIVVIIAVRIMMKKQLTRQSSS
jgi:nitrous oxidase accessory protein NosD